MSLHNQDQHISVNPADYLMPEDAMINPLEENPNQESLVLIYLVNDREVEVFSLINLN